MKGSRKIHTPPKMQAWLDKVSEDWRPSYPIDDTEVKNEVRGHLLADQRGLCVYCGRRLDLSTPGETYHVEHFRPRAVYPQLAVEYTNLFLSCGQKDDYGKPSPTCGNQKKNWFDEACHVEPVYPDCSSRFAFTLNGIVEPEIDGDMGAKNMIECLQLNYPELVKDRADILTMLDGGELDETDFFDVATNTGQSFAHVVYRHLAIPLP